MTRRTLLALVAAALIARLVAAILLGGSYHFADEIVYTDAARRLTDGLGFASSYNRAPGFPTLLAALPGLASESSLPLRLQLATITVIGCWLLYVLAERGFGRQAALVAVALYALDPLMVVSAGLLYPEAIAAVLLLTVVVLAERAARLDSLPTHLAAGAVLGVLAQFRPVALTLIPVIAAWAAWGVRGAAAPAPVRRLAHATTLLVACFLILAPWTYRNYRVHGGFVPIATAGTQLAPVDRDEIESRGLAAAMTRRALTEPVDLARRTARSFGQFWELYPTRLAIDDPESRALLNSQDDRVPLQATFPRSLRDVVSALSFGPELGLALIGLVAAWRRDPKTVALLLGTVLAFALGYALFVAKVRYRIPILPIMFVFSGVGAVSVYNQFLGWRSTEARRP